MKTVTCRYCKVKEPYKEKEKMIKHQIKTRHFYFHPTCFDTWNKQKEEEEQFKEQERKEKMALEKTMCEIHEVEEVPSGMYWQIEDIRNGNKRFQKFEKLDKKKQGYKYSVIEEAYNMSRKKIHWVRKNKGFKEIEHQMKYCLQIVKGKLMDAKRRLKERELEAEMFEMKKQNNLFKEMEDRPLTKKQKASNDISDFLD